MKWTRETPTASGWYWVLARYIDPEPCCVEVKLGTSRGDKAYFSGSGARLEDLEFNGALWAGPLLPPGEGEV